EQYAIVGNDADRKAHDVRETANQRVAVKRLEFVKPRSVYDSCDDLTHVKGLPDIGRNNSVNLSRVVKWWLGIRERPGILFFAEQICNDVAGNSQRVRVVHGVVVGDAADSAVDLCTAQFFGGNFLAGGRLD